MRRRALLLSLAAATAVPQALARESGSPAAPQNIVRIRPVMVPVTVNGHVERYATYEITLEVAQPGMMPRLQGMTPRLQDTATAVIYEGVGSGWIERGAITNDTALRRRLQEAFATLVGKDTIGRILVAPAAARGAH